VASPAHSEGFRRSALAEMSVASTWQSLASISLAENDSIPDIPTPQVVAQSQEFVTLPGVSNELQKLIPAALRTASCRSGDFLGCMVLISEQEARLVTVITLWTATAKTEHVRRNSAVLQDLLEPYVDRWTRSGSHIAFLTQLHL
jgi:hypothetical protein